MTIKVRLVGNAANRKRSKREMARGTSGHGQGRWHSRTTLWKARGKARRKRAIASASRKHNRQNA